MSVPDNRKLAVSDGKDRMPVRKVLITTLGRSGSSMIFDAFSQLTSRTYDVFEPLHDMREVIKRPETGLVSFLVNNCCMERQNMDIYPPTVGTQNYLISQLTPLSVRMINMMKFDCLKD